MFIYISFSTTSQYRLYSFVSFSTVIESQDLLMCGWNNKGQLGLGDTDDRAVLCHVQGLASVKQVSCGWNHTLAITGKLFRN